MDWIIVNDDIQVTANYPDGWRVQARLLVKKELPNHQMAWYEGPNLPNNWQII